MKSFFAKEKKKFSSRLLVAALRLAFSLAKKNFKKNLWNQVVNLIIALLSFNYPERSCSDIKAQNPQATSGSYVIDPDGDGGNEPFTVFCDMPDKNGVGVTVIGHDSEARTLVDGYEGPGSYVKNITYTATGLTGVAQLAGLADVSAHCEQFIKYECYGALLFRDGECWWVSRDNEKMIYWGGARPDDYKKCACGVTSPNSCVDPNYGCNCEMNDATWREDSGLLTEKSQLPVMELRFGDTGGSSEKGYHTLGKFKCYG